MSDDTARGKLQAECFKLHIRKKIPQQGDADQELGVWGGCVLCIWGVFRAQAGKAMADLTGGGGSPALSGSFLYLPSQSPFRQPFLWIHPVQFLTKGTAFFVPGVGNEYWIKGSTRTWVFTWSEIISMNKEISSQKQQISYSKISA